MKSTISLIGLILVAGCADTEAGSEWPLQEDQEPAAVDSPAVAQGPTAYDYSRASALLQGEWTEQNVGCVTQLLWEAFAPQGEFVTFTEEPDYADPDQALQQTLIADGDWSIDDRGVVTWSWELDGRTQTQRRSLVLVEEPLAAVASWASGAGQVWPSSGFAPSTADLRTFQNVYQRSTVQPDGTVYERGSTVDVELSAAPQELAAGADCIMSLTATLTDGSTATFDHPCEVSEGADPELRVIHAAGHPADWWGSSEQWRLELTASGHYESYDGQIAEELRAATVPVLIFDPRSPHQLVRPSDSVLARR